MFVPAPPSEPASSSRLGANHRSWRAGRTSAPRSATFHLASLFAPITPRVEAPTTRGRGGGVAAAAPSPVREARELDSVVVAESAAH